MNLETREQWLEERKKGIGGSDAGAILGINHYMSNTELWEYKTGKKEQPDIGHKIHVQAGIKAEEHIRALFAIDNPQYDVLYKPFDIRWSNTIPFIYSSLDGELVERETGERIVFEVKRTEVRKRVELDKWGTYENGTFIHTLPKSYYIQLLHALIATGFDRAILIARISIKWKEETIERRYEVTREEHQESIDILIEKETTFWNNHVLADVKPAMILPEI